MTGDRRVLPLGDHAVLVECSSPSEVLDLHETLRTSPLPGQVDVLAAARTVMVRTSGERATHRLMPVLAALPADPRAATVAELVTLDTVYDGVDLAAFASVLGISTQALVDAHTAAAWTGAFSGFAPGFVYLVSEDWPFVVPRQDSPRTAVPAGSVALAAGCSAVYPGGTPGGWQLVGRSRADVWDLDRDPPALLGVGTRIRFRPVRATARAGTTATPPAGRAGGPGAAPGRGRSPAVQDIGAPSVEGGTGQPAHLVVRATGPLSLVQDRGRSGVLDLGVGRSGAVDRGAAARANRLVGNVRDAAVVEAVLGGLVLEADGDCVLAVTGAPAAVRVRRADGAMEATPADAPFRLGAGERVELSAPPVGLRSYVAVRGGVDVPPVLGSRSTDVLSGIGPAALVPGTRLPVGTLTDGAVGLPDPARPVQGGMVTVRVAPGPRADLFSATDLELLHTQAWQVTEQSNRVGLRLAGRRLDARAGDLPSEGMVTGAVQVPPSGLPVVFLADHPVTGGYPVVAVVRDDDLDLLGQLRPGQLLRLCP